MNLQYVGYKIELLNSRDRIAATVPEIRLLYLLDGEGSVRMENGSFTALKMDMVLINTMEPFELVLDQEAIAALLSIDFFTLCDELEVGCLWFHLNSVTDTGQKYIRIRQLFQKMLMVHLGNEFAGTFLELGCFHNLLYLLLTTFLARIPSDMADRGDLRIASMLRYIRMNYTSNLSLNEIAEQLYLSPSTASRLFQKATGRKFASYVKHYRLERVQYALLHSEASVTRIALDHGFATPSALNKVFRKEYGVTPTEFRKQQPVSTQSAESVQSVQREKVYQILQEQQKLQEQDLQSHKMMVVDVSQMNPWKRWENRLLNIGPARFLTSAAMQKQVLFMVDQLDVEYIRVCNLFSSKLMIDTTGMYNFTFVDEIMDFCVDNRIKLWIEMVQRRELALASENRRIYDNEGDPVFSSQKEWEQTLEAFFSHIRQRYHEQVVGQWVFEFTFFLNDQPYFCSEQYSSEVVWKRGYELVKKHVPSAQVAGPGLVAADSKEKTEQLVQHFLETKHHPDLFTMMCFPYAVDGSVLEGEIYHGSFPKIAGRHFIREQIEIVKNSLKQCDYRAQLWITDWGNSIANRNYIQDSCYRGAFIVENVLYCQDAVGAMGLFYASDLLNAFSDSNTLLSGSGGLLSRNGICKPAFYAYHFLSKLGRNRLGQNECCIVTAEGPNDLRILCFNSKELGPKYYLQDEDSFRPNELSRLYLDNDPLHLDIVLRFPDSSDVYTLRQKVLNEKKGSILDHWIGFGCSSHLSRSDIEYLEKSAIPEITMERLYSTDGELKLNITLEPNELRLITIMKE